MFPGGTRDKAAGVRSKLLIPFMLRTRTSGSTFAGPHTPSGVRKDTPILTFYKYNDTRHVVVQSKDKPVPVQAKKAYEGLDVQYHSFLTSALD